MEKDYFNFSGYNAPPYYGYDTSDGSSSNQADSSNMFNPMVQYEQAYMYYRYLSQQMEYKIKCKEYEKLISNDYSKSNSRKIE